MFACLLVGWLLTLRSRGSRSGEEHGLSVLGSNPSSATSSGVVLGKIPVLSMSVSSSVIEGTAAAATYHGGFVIYKVLQTVSDTS